VTLDAVGNITCKQAVDSYTYHATKKRTVIGHHRTVRNRVGLGLTVGRVKTPTWLVARSLR